MALKTLYITDLDGTLLNSDKEISEYSKNTINTIIAKGVHFSVATARTAASSLKILSCININVPVVLMNGVVIYDTQLNRYIKIEEISVQSAHAIIDVLKEYEITGFMYTISGDTLVTYYENLNTKPLKDFHNERIMRYNKSFVQLERFSDKILKDKIIYFTLIDEYKRLSKVLDALKNHPDIDAVLYRDIYAEDLWYLEIHSINASKYKSVKFLREYCKFDRIIGFGDNLNDIPLFKACDECYAVSNAVHGLKEVASGIIGDNHSDAVATFIAQRELTGI